MMNSKLSKWALVGVLAAVALFQVAAAADNMIITARKTSENILDVPVSVIAIDAEQIEAAGFQDINDISELTPGIKFNSAFGRQGDRPVIRGVSAITTGIDPAGFFVDGIYVAESLQSYDLSAVERVEIIKGPQSATFGRRTFSGAINYVTKAPSEDLLLKVSGEAGSNALIRTTATVSDTVGAIGYRVTGNYYSYDGDFDNTLTGATFAAPDDIGGEETMSLNGSLYWNISDDHLLKFNVVYSDDDDDHFAIALQPSAENNCFFDMDTRPYYCGTLQTNTPVSLGGFFDPDDYGVELERLRTSVRGEHDLGAVQLTWVGAYNTAEDKVGTDVSFQGAQTAFSFATFGQVPASDWHTFEEDDTDDYSVEVWLRGNAMNEALKWAVGGYLYDEEAERLDLNGNRVFEDITTEEITNTAIMGLVEYDFAEKFRLGLEVRYAEDEITESQFDGTTTLSNSDTFESFTYRATASWFLAEETMAYLSASTGVLPGDFNTDTQLPASLISIDEQELQMFELGIKTAVNDALTFTGAIYLQEWKDQQRSQFIIIGGNPVNYQANQGTTDFLGIEGQALWRIADGWEADVAFSYNNTEVKNFVSDDATDVDLTNQTGDVSGAQLPLSPELEASASLTYTAQLNSEFELATRLDASFQDSRYVRLVNFAETGSATLVNLNVTLATDTWSVSLWGKNLTDEDSVVSGLRYIENDSFFFGGRAFAITPRVGTEVGITGRYRFGG